MIVRVSVVLNRTVVGSDCRFDKMCRGRTAVVIFRVKVSRGWGGCFTSLDGI